MRKDERFILHLILVAVSVMLGGQLSLAGIPWWGVGAALVGIPAAAALLTWVWRE